LLHSTVVDDNAKALALLLQKKESTKVKNILSQFGTVSGEATNTINWSGHTCRY
jgi:hypothetical protein